MQNKRECWQLYLTAKTTSSRPSDLIGIADRWAALQFDNAITYAGTVIENALQEYKEVGQGKTKKMELKYTLAQLLDPKFRLPKPKRNQTGGVADLAKAIKRGR